MTTITLTKKIEGRKFKRPFSWLSTPDRIVKKQYQVPYINGRALRNSDVVASLIEKARKGEAFTPAEVDNCCEWFCGLFQNQFTADELLDGYDVDALMPDIFAAYMAVSSGTMKVLTEFPIPPTTNQPKNQ
jgi:hypothetical protein